MQRLVRSTVTMVAMMMTFGAITSATAAQFSPEDVVRRLDGIETAYARKYIADRELGFATPVVSDASTPSTITITVLEFDTNENATSAADGLINAFVAKLILGKPDVDLGAKLITGLGDQATLFTGIDEFFNPPQHVALLAVQDGRFGFLIQAFGADDEMQDVMTEIAASMLDSTVGSEKITLTNGLANGSTFDLMPGRDDADLLHGLIPMYDYDLLGPGGSHPLDHISTPEASLVATQW